MPADAKFERTVQPGLLDRLLDDDPDTRNEAAVSRSESLRRFRASIKRDLEWLLNTVSSGEPLADTFREAKTSVITYGLPDISSYSLQVPADEARLLRSLEAAIERFEPRLKRVRVSNPHGISSTQQAIVFHIDALLLMDPAPERIAFDTVLEVGKGAYSVKET